MVAKDDRPGLLSKVAMFVRNPTKDWSELDQPADAEASGYDKQALKAMIERKRQNDFVRKREFDQLRKLRNRDPGTMAIMARPSFFQTSLPTDLNGRAGTIKKIDEIEAQMSHQWWKSKNEGGVPGSATQPDGLPAREPGDSGQELPNSEPFHGSSVPFASTLPHERRPGPASEDDDFLPTVMASNLASLSGLDMLADGDARADGAPGFSTSRLFAIEIDEMATDPELEEAAIRFANSDDAGAERGLLAALRGNDLAPHAAQSWAAALLDFYRATGQRAAFDVAVDEFALHLDGGWPVWSDLAEAAALAQPVFATTNTPLGTIWDCPPTLTAADMERLRLAMVSQPMPWSLDWSALQTIAPDALGLLDALFASLCEEPLSLRFVGEDRVTQALRALTPSGNRFVDPVCWQLRLNALRAMHMQDDFELAALDYCVTYGVSPPAWVDARCRFEGAARSGATSDFGAPTIPLGAPVDADAGSEAPRGFDGARALVLQGQILGDASHALAVLDAVPVNGKRMVITCGSLIRVDFAAAGSILNWAATRQAEGIQVQFQNVHRLVAAFFNVIGINEYAKVIPRSI